MAKAAAAPATPETGEKKKGKGKMMIILIALIVLLAGGGAGAYFMLAAKSDGHDKEVKPKEHAGPPSFSVMDPFVVNLTDPDSTRYLQIGMTYELSNAKAAEELKNYTPIIRSRILLVLSGKNVKELSSIEGKQRLMDELVDLARVTLHGDGKDPNNGVRDVHFSSFVIQ